jgi:hypothetical protein
MNELSSLFHKHANGERLSFEEEEDLCGFLMIMDTDNPDIFKKFEAICSDHIFIRALGLKKVKPDARIERLLHKNYNPYAEYQKRIDAFESKYDSNAADLFLRQVRTEYNQQSKSNRQRYSGNELVEKNEALKAKLEFLRIRTEKVYDDYLAKHNLSSLDIQYGGVTIRFDKVSIMHILSRHVFRNESIDLDVITGKSRFNLSSLEEIIDKIKWLFSSLPDPGNLSSSEPISIFFKTDLQGDIFAVHTKIIPASTSLGAPNIQRLETYYPVEETQKISEIQQRGFKRINPALYLANS